MLFGNQNLEWVLAKFCSLEINDASITHAEEYGSF